GQFDVKSLDADKEKIVYEQGGYLHVLNPKTGEDKQLEIYVSGDMNFSRERWEDVTAGNLSNPDISPTGKRAVFEYRGEIFTIPKEDGTWRNLTNSSGVADRYPVWSPEGDKIAWFSDESGEYQLVISEQDGLNKKEYKLPNPTFFYSPQWSPDGKKIAFSDTDYNIWFIDLDTGIAKKVDTDRFAHPNRFMNPSWSPDNRWIAYPRLLENNYKAAFVYNIETEEQIQLTDGMADVPFVAWDKSGKYLYFLASTNYGLNSGWLDMSSYDPDFTRSLYCLILSNEDPSPTLPKSDEEEIKGEVKAGNGEKEDKKDKKENDQDKKDDTPTVKIDRENLAQRIIALGEGSKNYSGLLTGPENSVFILEDPEGARGSTLHKYDLKKLKSEVFLEGIRQAVVSFDTKNILYQKGSSWNIVGTSAKPKDSDGNLKMDVKIKIDPKAEYKQIFKEGWRFMRDYLYVDNVHGAPWDKIYEWYSPWIDYVRHRTDLNYVVDILSGEVSIGHSYVRGGDMPDIERVPVGLLGCDFKEENGFYKISRIYTGESWNHGLEAPLAIPGIKIKEGDFLLEVNGKTLRAPENPYSLFEQTAGRELTLTTNSKPTLEGSVKTLVKTVSNDGQLRNFDWIENNRKKVDELSGGKIAYVYVPNTSNAGFDYFNRYYFAQQDKKGVIIDERNNGGGSAADYFIDIMTRHHFGYFNSKANNHRPWTTPMAGIWGPKVMIINERAGSGGDLFPYMFKEAKIGPLVGTRTWGGLVGTWDTPAFIDGGRMVAPRGGFFDVNGEWAVEGEGISPDIEVIQEPGLVLQGKDPQLEKAVEEALKLLKNNEFIMRSEPEAPKKWKRPDYFKMQ
ncbi:MAG: PDZ domain-containing protein, partial [Prolixibacteraceae bacterium]|nr:PDZ domain-containing protein [Prolixibacteraceae bacterium]